MGGCDKMRQRGGEGEQGHRVRPEGSGLELTCQHSTAKAYTSVARDTTAPPCFLPRKASGGWLALEG